MRRLRGLVISLALAACAAAAGVALYLVPLGTLSAANRIEDYRLQAAVFARAGAPAYEQTDDAIALVTIDDESIGNAHAGLGPFPFPRSVYGRLLQRLGAAGARAAAFDVDFLEPSSDPAQDAAFAAGARALPAVIGYPVTTTSRGVPGAELPPRVLRDAMHLGFTTIDSPGGLVVGQPPRIGPMPPGFPGGTAWSLSAAAVNAMQGGARKRPPELDGQLLLVPFPLLGTVDTTQRAGAQVLHAGFVGQQLSLADALTIPPADLQTFARGRLVLIGATAQALADKVPTVAGIVPGLFVHARLADQLLRGLYLRPAPVWVNLALIVLLPLLLAALLTHLRPGPAVAIAVVAIAAYAALALALFTYRLYWIDLLHTGGAMLLAAAAAVAYRVITESAARRMVTDVFGRHVSPAVVQELLRAEDPRVALDLRGKRARVTIFYSDIRGFSTMSERMTAEAMYEQLNEYFEAMCAVIFKHGGYVDKFIGDCIMSVFSAPNPQPGDARRAVEAALEQQQVIAELSQRWAAQGREPFTVGMGINTGYVVMGNLGAQTRMNYTVIGDDVNVAARLYDVAKGGQIVISESTWAEVREDFAMRELEPVRVKGKSLPLRTFEVLGRPAPPAPNLLVEPERQPPTVV